MLALSALTALGVVAALTLGATMEEILVPVLAVTVLLLLLERRRGK